ncbi:MAG: DUF177 domain-containing protein [Bacteroidota bacterium]
MFELKEFSIPIKGLNEGMHEFDYQIDKSFFQHFEASPIEEAQFDLKLFFDKRPDMIVLTFDLKGTVKTECDRCLEELQLPISNAPQLLIKYAVQEKEDAEIVYIQRERDELNVTRYVYEFICLSMPMIKYHSDTEECDAQMLKYLDRDEEQQADNPIWDELKNFDQKE